MLSLSFYLLYFFLLILNNLSPFLRLSFFPSPLYIHASFVVFWYFRLIINLYFSVPLFSGILYIFIYIFLPLNTPSLFFYLSLSLYVFSFSYRETLYVPHHFSSSSACIAITKLSLPSVFHSQSFHFPLSCGQLQQLSAVKCLSSD